MRENYQVSKKNRKEHLIHSKWLFTALLICVFIIVLITAFALLQHRNRSTKSYSYEIIPEYDRVMGKIVISLPTINSSVPALSLNSHFEILQYIPAYTQIMIILPESRVDEIKIRFEKYPVKNKITFHPFKTRALKKGNMYLIFAENEKLVDSGPMENIIIPKGTIWAQDLFEPAKLSSGNNLLLMPDAYKMFYSDESKSMGEAVNVQPDNLDFCKRFKSGNYWENRQKCNFRL